MRRPRRRCRLGGAGGHVAGALRRVRSGELPIGYHRPALPPVHRHDRRVGHHLHGRGADVEPRDVFPACCSSSPTTDARTASAARPRAECRQPLLRKDDPARAEPFALHVCSLRHRARGDLGAQPPCAAELHAAGVIRLLHRRTSELPEGATIDVRAPSPTARWPSHGRPRDVDYVLNVTGSSPRRHEPAAQPAHRDPCRGTNVNRRIRCGWAWRELERYPESKVCPRRRRSFRDWQFGRLLR